MAVVAVLGASTPTLAQQPGPTRVAVELEGGFFWVSRDVVRIPPQTGTEFSLLDLTGKGPAPFLRVSASIDLAPRHGFRVTAAPVGFGGTGSFVAPVLFADRVFHAGVPTEGIYKFNTYRFTYRYALHTGEKWRVEIGAAGLIRDAKIELRQTDAEAQDTDVGFVPLAYVSVRRSLGDRASLVLDVEGLGASQGRAIDAALKVDYRLNRNWSVGAGYRTIEGGADVESVFNFAWLHFGVLSVGYRF